MYRTYLSIVLCLIFVYSTFDYQKYICFLIHNSQVYMLFEVYYTYQLEYYHVQWAQLEYYHVQWVSLSFKWVEWVKIQFINRYYICSMCFSLRLTHSYMLLLLTFHTIHLITIHPNTNLFRLTHFWTINMWFSYSFKITLDWYC